jgi:hypothetical protein
MIEVAYISEASSSLAPDEVFKIIETSARNNLRDELTGFLIFADNRFFQVIEGPPASIDALMERLERDSRHSSIEIISRRDIDERSFPKWRMERVKANDALSSSARASAIPPRLRETISAFLNGSAVAHKAA